MYSTSFASDQADGLRNAKKAQSTKVIAVTAGKGGVGKTNITAALAIGLAQHDKKVLVFDGDLGLANIDVLLGLTASQNLSHVIRGQCQLNDILLDGPEGIKILPSSSGFDDMTNLDKSSCSAIVSAFSEIVEPIDYLLVDTAAGISYDVSTFTASAQEVIVVVCDEPTSLTDAYALMKIMSQKYHVRKFHVIANMVRHPSQGRALYLKLLRVSEKFLDITLDYLGSISYDVLLHESVKSQKSIISAYPNSLASREIKRIISKIESWSRSEISIEKQNFFLEKLIESQQA